MSLSCWLACKTFLEAQAPAQQETLLSFLPDSIYTSMKGAWSTFSTVSRSPVYETLTDFLPRVHGAWFVPFFNKHIPSEWGIYLGCLTPTQQKTIQGILGWHEHIARVTSTGKAYLLHHLCQFLVNGEDLVPVAMLTSADMGPLLDLSTTEMTALACRLGVRDLAKEINRIVDKRKLLAIHACLQEGELRLLQHLAGKKERVAFGALDLSHWQGGCAWLRKTLEQRGINRLAKALFTEHRSFRWYLLRTLDVTWADFFTSLCVDVPQKDVRDALRQQVVEALAYLYKERV